MHTRLRKVVLKQLSLKIIQQLILVVLHRKTNNLMASISLQSLALGPKHIELMQLICNEFYIR